MRLALSIKQLEADPLLETLDTLMPAQTRVSYFFHYRGITASVGKYFSECSITSMIISIFTIGLWTNLRG